MSPLIEIFRSFGHINKDKNFVKNVCLRVTSDQDGGIGRHTLLPWTTKRRITTNFKTKNNQNCQNVQLYGSLTTTDLKTKYSSQWVGGVKTRSLDEEDTVWQ